MASVSRPMRSLKRGERERLRVLDDAVPRRRRAYRLVGGYEPVAARDAGSREYAAMRAYVVELLCDGVPAGVLSVELSLSIAQVRLWRKGAVG